MEGDVRIHRLDRWSLAYESDRQTLIIPVEDLDDGKSLAVYLDDVLGSEAPDERSEIRRELTDSYSARGVTLEFDPAE